MQATHAIFLAPVPSGAALGALLAGEEASRTYARAVLRLRRRERLVASASGLFRGAPALFYALAAEHPGARSLVHGQTPRWIVGDVHLENLGVIDAAHGALRYDFNDLDEACVALPGWDVLRATAAAVVGARDLGVAPATAVAAARALLAAYHGDTVPRAPKALRRVLARARARTQRQLLDERCPLVRGVRKFTLGERYLPLRRDERRTVETLVQAYCAADHGAGLDQHAALVDTAFRVQGTGSLGVHRFAALVRGHRGLVLLEAKAMRPSAVVTAGLGNPGATANEGTRGTHEAQRVVTATAALLGPMDHPPRAVTGTDGRGYLVRRYAPGEDKLAVVALAGRAKALVSLAAVMGARLREAHVRSGGARGMTVKNPLALEVALDLAAAMTRAHQRLLEEG